MRRRRQTADSIHKLHPIESLGNAPARRGEIRIERIESRLNPKVPFPHRHDFFHFLYLERGSGWHEIDFSRFQAEAGQLFFVKPGEVHSWALGAGTRGFVLEFTRESLAAGPKTEEILRNLGTFPSLVFPRDPQGLRAHLGLMQAELEAEEKEYRLTLEHYLSAFLLKIFRLREKASPVKAARPSLMDRFKDLLEENFRREHAVEFYAEKLGITPKSLTTQSTRALGKSAGALIQERCLVEAKRLLAYSEMPIAEIGYGLGFEDPNYFARFFRQRSGLSPGKFRKLASHSVH
jgi:AraC family transcriptional activator of pobA